MRRATKVSRHFKELLSMVENVHPNQGNPVPLDKFREQLAAGLKEGIMDARRRIGR